MYEIINIDKETYKNNDIETIYYYNKEKNMLELWLKMSDIEVQLGHSNIADVVLKGIRKYLGKKTKYITKEEKEQCKCYFENKKGVFIIEKLARDVTKCCKLPEAIELRKKLGYNHDDIMIREETSIAEKIIKLFPNENIVLNKTFNGRKPDIGSKIMVVLLKLMKEIMKIMIQTTKKKEKKCLKDIILKFLDVIPMILILIFLNL